MKTCLVVDDSSVVRKIARRRAEWHAPTSPHEIEHTPESGAMRHTPPSQLAPGMLTQSP